MLNYLPKWLVIGVILAVGIEQLAVRLPDVLLAWDAYQAKSAGLHSATQTADDKPRTAAERKAEAEAEKAQADACQSRLQLLTQNIIPGDFTESDHVKPGTKTARMMAQYDKDCGQITGDSQGAPDSSARDEAVAAGVRVYQALKESALNLGQGAQFNDAQAAMEAACILGTRLTAPDVGDELSMKMVRETLRSCAQAVVAYKFILAGNDDLGSPHDLSKAPAPDMRSVWIADDLATKVKQCVPGNPGYAGLLSCSCAAGAEAGTRAISLPSNDAIKAISGATARCTTLSTKLAEGDGPTATQTYLSALRLDIAKTAEAKPDPARDLANKLNDGKLKIRTAVHAGDYAKAFGLALALEDDVEKTEIRNKGQTGALTADALVEVAWWGLFAQEFQKSLDASDRALQLEPGDLVTLTNRAHALMFLGFTDEARRVYLGHEGERFQGEGQQLQGKPWEQAIAADFVELRKAGLTKPLMSEVEAAFGNSSTQSGQGTVWVPPPHASIDPPHDQQTAAIGSATVNTINLNLRSGPGTSYDVIATMPQGLVVQVLANATDAWEEVEAPGANGTVVHGYANGKFLSPSQ